MVRLLVWRMAPHKETVIDLEEQSNSLIHSYFEKMSGLKWLTRFL